MVMMNLIPNAEANDAAAKDDPEQHGEEKTNIVHEFSQCELSEGNITDRLKAIPKINIGDDGNGYGSIDDRPHDTADDDQQSLVYVSQHRSTSSIGEMIAQLDPEKCLARATSWPPRSGIPPPKSTHSARGCGASAGS